MKTIERLSEVIGRLHLCDGVEIPVRQGVFKGKHDIGVFLPEVSALLPENPYSIFVGIFKKLRASRDKVLSKNNKHLMEQRAAQLSAMTSVVESIPELRNQDGGRWHVYNPTFLPLHIFGALTRIIAERGVGLGLCAAPEVKRMQEETGIVPLIWFEAWERCFSTNLTFVGDCGALPLMSSKWRTMFVDAWIQPAEQPQDKQTDAARQEPEYEEAETVMVEPELESEEGHIVPVSTDSVTEDLLGERYHYPMCCDATLSYTMTFTHSPELLRNIVDMLRIKDISIIDDVRVGENSTVELTLLTTICDMYPAAVNLQVEKLHRLSKVIDKVYNSIIRVLQAADEQSEVLLPLVGPETVTEDNSDNDIH